MLPKSLKYSGRTVYISKTVTNQLKKAVYLETDNPESGRDKVSDLYTIFR